jgi:hypothetical protein
VDLFVHRVDYAPAGLLLNMTKIRTEALTRRVMEIGAAIGHHN